MACSEVINAKQRNQAKETIMRYKIILALLIFCFPSFAAEFRILDVNGGADTLKVRWECRGAVPISEFMSIQGQNVLEHLIDSLQSEQLPTQVLLLIDTSIPMRSAVTVGIIPTIRQLLQDSLSNYSYALATFDAELKFHDGFEQPPDSLIRQLESINVSGHRTELYRLILEALGKFSDNIPAHRILVIFSDGEAEDTAYEVKEVINKANDLRVSIVAAGYRNRVVDQSIRRIAEETGGKFWRATDNHQLDDEFVPYLQKFPNSSGTIVLASDSLGTSKYGTKTITAGVIFRNGTALENQVTWNLPERYFRLYFLIGGAAFILIIIIFVVISSKRNKTRLAIDAIEKERREKQVQSVAIHPNKIAEKPRCPSCNAIIHQQDKVCNSCGVPLALLKGKTALAWLVSDKGKLAIRKTNCQIGAISANDIVINHPKISRHHSEITFKDGEFYIRDKDSENGTYLNNDPDRISNRKLIDGDVVKFAKLEFHFRIDPTIRQKI